VDNSLKYSINIKNPLEKDFIKMGSFEVENTNDRFFRLVMLFFNRQLWKDASSADP